MRRPAADDQAQVEHVLILPAPVTTHMRVVTITQANFTHDIDAQAFDFMAKFRAYEFHNHTGEADVLILVNLGRQQAHIVVLHGEHPAL